ncbi:hypothetical protein ACFQLX_17180 [Streptomyces polyrhachis]|uniref:FXSXX-COOH protein n=1 Tax=Streptomyces polyrhachis TaxID=1282885 RepID=A0ABW2GGL8_9ACTN
MNTDAGRADADGALAPPLPDLSGVGLVALRDLHTPQLAAAVDWILLRGAAAEEGYEQPYDQPDAE